MRLGKIVYYPVMFDWGCATDSFVLISSTVDRWEALLDKMPQEHRRIEQWAAKLEATLDEEDERKRRDANFDPKNLPPYEHSLAFVLVTC